MDNKKFKKIFGNIAKNNGFEYSFGGWFKESAESIIVLNLQKSNFSNSYDMNIKIYIQGMFGHNYIRNKDLVVKDTGDIFRRQPTIFSPVFDFDNLMDDEKRQENLKILFRDFILPFTDKVLSKSGIKELAEKGDINLLPAIKENLSYMN